jgi:peptidoglycan hydrolase CwlO-like protein
VEDLESLKEKVTKDISALKFDVQHLNHKDEMLETQDTRLNERLDELRSDVEALVKIIETRYVTLARYITVERSVFGFIVVIVMAVLGAVVSGVIK